jgi:hypothetical protein
MDTTENRTDIKVRRVRSGAEPTFGAAPGTSQLDLFR